MTTSIKVGNPDARNIVKAIRLVAPYAAHHVNDGAPQRNRYEVWGRISEEVAPHAVTSPSSATISSSSSRISASISSSGRGGTYR